MAMNDNNNNDNVHPIKLKSLLQLRQLGISENSIKYNNITMESDKCVVIKEATKLSIVNISTRNVISLPVTLVDSAIMNPSSNVLGIRHKNNLQIFNLDIKTKIKTIELNNSDDILYWRWLDSRTISYVTSKSVYHWSMENDSKPEKKFDIVADERKVQCINYDASKDGNWLFLQSIARKNDSIQGVLQLFNVPSKKYQPKMTANGGCFGYLNINGRDATLFCFTKKDENGTKLFIVEVGNNNSDSLKIQRNLRFENENDFMISMIPSPKYGCIYACTQMGYLYIFDLMTGKEILHHHKISNFPLFIAVTTENNEGILICDRAGKVSTIIIDENNYIQYIKHQLNDPQLAMQIATRCNLRGAEDLFKQRFIELISSLKYQQAIRLAINAPREILRTPETIQTLQQAPNASGSPPADLQYYTILLQQGILNEYESIGLCQRILNAKPGQPGIDKIEKFLKEKKLTNSENLGDLLVKYSPKLAASVYYYAKIPNKTILCFIKSGKSDKVIQYALNENYNVTNWSNLLENVQIMNRDNLITFAKQLIEKNYLKPTEIVAILLGSGRNDIEKTTEFILEYLSNRGDRKEDAELQTKLLEINLRSAPQVAAAILESDDYIFTQFDKNYIAKLCESARLYYHALKLFVSLDDIKRVLQSGISANLLTKDFIMTFFGDLTPEDALECLRDLLAYQSTTLHLNIVVEICQRFNDQLTSQRLVKLFEDHQCYNGLYLYLRNLINSTKDSDIIYKFIIAAAECGQFEEIKNICAENDVYDPEQIKTFLLESVDKITDPRPLIHVCDRHGFVDELTHYLYSNQLYRFIEVYVTKMNQASTPKVIGSLLDLNAPEDQIRNLLNNVRPPQCPIDELVDECEKRERLNILLNWLETRYNNEGIKDESLHSALAKIYVNINNNPRHFLMTNKFYNHESVGKYCQSRDPRLSFTAYLQSNGKCDQLLIEVANKNGFYKDLAKHLVERQDLQFWNNVLNENEEDNDIKEDEHRQSVIDQVINSILPECRQPEQIVTTVKAFMNADIPHLLIQLLEKIVLHSINSDYNNFRNNSNLQNLLIITAIKSDPSKIKGYIEDLDNYDGISIAKICKEEDNKLYQEAFSIYKKFNHNVEAIDVLLYDLNDLERAKEFAEYICDQSDVWSILGKAQLDNDMISESIESFLKAKDAQYYHDVIAMVSKFGHENEALYGELITFLKMARDKVRDKSVDSELIYCYGKIKDLVNLEKFINDQHNASLNKVGDRLFNESLFESAKIIFEHINNYGKLALCFVRLQDLREAVDAARKANSIQIWKDVCFSCVDFENFKLAQICGINIIIFMDHMNDLIKYYENKGYFAELIYLLEQGINLDRVHQGIYTQLGVLYAKYNDNDKNNKLMEHINLFWTRLNIQTLLQSCKDNEHWKECVILYTHYEAYDQAAEIIMAHSAQCWQHDQFKHIMLKINSNYEIYYRAINFYLREQPLKLSELLIELSSTKLDHKRVISIFSMNQNKLSLIKSYLEYNQKLDIKVINETLNNLLIEENDYKSLKQSVETFKNFDQIALAQTLQKHELLEFRRISAILYRNNKRYKVSIELLKQDKLWQDSMESAKLSNDQQIVEELLRYFVDGIKSELCPKSCFAACLFTCFDLIKPDIVLELSWKHDLFQLSMPFMIQAMRTWNQRFDELTNKVQLLQEKLMENNDKTQMVQNQQSFNLYPQIPMIEYNDNTYNRGLGMM